jgi:hypothetical protein
MTEINRQQRDDNSREPKISLSDCQLAAGHVVYDVIVLAVGAVALRARVSEATIEAVTTSAVPVLTELESTIAMIAASGSTTLQRAQGVFQILRTISDGGLLPAVFDAFANSLSWWDAVLYGVGGIATILAALATDGIAFAAEIAALLATFGLLVSDSVDAVTACGFTPPALAVGEKQEQEQAVSLASGSNPFPFEPQFAICTYGGYLLTAVNGGNINTPGAAIVTNATVFGHNEKFTIVPIDQTKKTFALQTFNGNYVTAVNGGGQSCSTCPINTNLKVIGQTEVFVLEQRMDGTFGLLTTSGYLLTAVKGGGVGGVPVIRTDSTTIGNFETFTLVGGQAGTLNVS